MCANKIFMLRNKISSWLLDYFHQSIENKLDLSLTVKNTCWLQDKVYFNMQNYIVTSLRANNFVHMMTIAHFQIFEAYIISDVKVWCQSSLTQHCSDSEL